MRVAVCISGEMRTFRQNYDALKKKLIDAYNSDVFISTWTSSHALNNKGEAFKMKIEQDELISLYQPKGLSLYEFDSSMFYEYNGVKVPEALLKAKPTQFRANIPQFFLMKNCNDLKRDFEIKGNFKYDFVIRVRPDLLILKEINLKKLDTNKIYLKHVIRDTYYCDQFAIGSSSLMDKYTSLFDRLNEYWLNPIQDGQFKHILNGETLMRHHILFSKLPYDRLNILFPIIRFEDNTVSILKKIYLNNIKNLIKIFFMRLGLMNNGFHKGSQ